VFLKAEKAERVGGEVPGTKKKVKHPEFCMDFKVCVHLGLLNQLIEE